jgi:hypothetical protein
MLPQLPEPNPRTGMTREQHLAVRITTELHDAGLNFETSPARLVWAQMTETIRKFRVSYGEPIDQPPRWRGERSMSRRPPELLKAVKKFTAASRAYNKDCNIRWDVKPDAKRRRLKAASKRAYDNLVRVISAISAKRKTCN